MCTCRDRGAVELRLMRSDLGEDVADLGFELGVKDSAAEEKLVLVVLHCCAC